MTRRLQKQLWHFIQIYLNIKCGVVQLVLIPDAIYYLHKNEKEFFQHSFHCNKTKHKKTSIVYSFHHFAKSSSITTPPKLIRKKHKLTAQLSKKRSFFIKPQHLFSSAITDICSSSKEKHNNQRNCTYTTKSLIEEKNNSGQAN